MSDSTPLVSESTKRLQRIRDAAPDIFEALELLFDHWTGKSGPADRDSDETVEETVRAALAKARGEVA